MGVTYRGRHSSEFGLSVKTNPSMLPPITLLTQEVPNRPGAYFIGSKYGMRTIPLEIAFISNDLKDYSTRMRTLANWLRPDLGIGDLVDDNEPDKTYYAVLQDQDVKRLDKIARAGQGTLTLACPDPYAYGAEQTIAGTTVNNTGSAGTQPVFTVTFSKTATSFKIDHTETGKFINIIYNFAANDVLVIDVSKRKITINNNLQMPTLDWKNSRWFNLQEGANHFTVSPSGVATTKITYRPRW